VDAADVRLCVLSAVEDMIDPDVTRLITPSTYLLVNKADSVNNSDAQDDSMLDQISRNIASRLDIPPKAAWAASVRTGIGMRGFVDGLETVLREQFVCSPHHFSYYG
jgi:hypothetical protein